MEDYTLLDNIYIYNNIPKEHLPTCNVYGYGDSCSKIINYLSVIN